VPELVRPDARWVASFVDALREGYRRDPLRPETPEMIAAVEGDPEVFLAGLRNPPPTLILPDGSIGPAVPSTMLWWVEGGAFLGSVSVRHDLNPTLEILGGHVGYAVRPSARGQGHATAILAAGLDWVRTNLPLRRVLLTINTANLPSIRVAEKNGGVHTQTVPHLWNAGEEAAHYWIVI
jgi:predicted acetyltransferase